MIDLIDFFSLAIADFPVNITICNWKGKKGITLKQRNPKLLPFLHITWTSLEHMWLAYVLRREQIRFRIFNSFLSGPLQETLQIGSCKLGLALNSITSAGEGQQQFNSQISQSVSTVVLVSESRRTHGYIVLSHVCGRRATPFTGNRK
jgi:hypothetical protein